MMVTLNTATHCGSELLRKMAIRYLLATLLLLLPVSSLALTGSHTRRGPTAGHHKSSHKRAAEPVRPRVIDDSRASEIQTALVKAGYLPAVSGHWDSDSQAAMQKLQADNGWQTKLIPDSRALIKLGLGPGAEAAPASANSSQSSAASQDSVSGDTPR